jgi:DNA-binding NarL/FixJ family response regulator
VNAAEIRVVVVDDQELVRAGFGLILQRHGMEVVGEAADGLAAVEVVTRTRPDVVLMDVRMPRQDGISATRDVVARCPESRVLVLTTFDLDDHVFDAVRAGASGFLLKDVTPEDLVYAVRLVARGDTILAPGLTRRLLERFAVRDPGSAARVDGLPEREREVLVLVARGLPNADIAVHLHLSPATVKTYVSRLLTRLDARDRVQLAVLAYESGLVRAGQPGS